MPLAAATTLAACVTGSADTAWEEPVAQAAQALDTYTQTRYPIVLCHGMAGFTSLFGVFDYFHGIDTALREGGATVFVTHVPGFASNEARGEELLAEVEDIVARTGAPKVNLIGHSQGGLDVRYVAAMRPDLVASVTTLGAPHRGTDLADWLIDHVSEDGVVGGTLGFLANGLGTVLGLLSGHPAPQDAIASLHSVSSEGMAAFNARFPAGLPTTPCGSGPASENGIAFYSWGGDSTITNPLDASDPFFALTARLFHGDNDGLVGRCSAHFGVIIRDDFRMNHLDEINQLLGLTALFSTNPVAVFRSHANRLKNAGL